MKAAGSAPAWQDNVSFVLVEPKEPGNIGAAARAMKTMGFRNLCLVGPPPSMNEEGRWFARNSHDVLDGALVHGSIADAVKDMSVVVGTTRIRGGKRGVVHPVRTGAATVRALAGNNRVAILFGREARGLSRTEMGECGFMLSIPSSGELPSLNLSHAVQVVAYELFLAGEMQRGAAGTAGEYVVPPYAATAPEFVAHGALEGVYGQIEAALGALGYLPDDRSLRENTIGYLKRFIGRAGLTAWELRALEGVCHRIVHTSRRSSG